VTTSPLDDLFNASAGGDFFSQEIQNQRFEVTKIEAGGSKSGGDPQLKANLTARGGPEDGKVIIHRMTYKKDGSEGAKSILNRSLAALGVTPEFAKQVASGVPEESQVITLFIEVAKVAKGRFVRADTVKQGGDGEYKDRVQVSYALKADDTVTLAQLGGPDPVTPPPAVAAETDEVAALRAQLAALETAKHPPAQGAQVAPAVAVDSPPF